MCVCVTCVVVVAVVVVCMLFSVVVFYLVRPVDLSPGVMTRTQPRPPVVLYMSAFRFSLQPNYIICGLRSKRR